MSQHEIREGREPTEAKKIAVPRPRDEQLPLFVHAGAGFRPGPMKALEPISDKELQENRRASKEARTQTPFFRCKAPGGHKPYIEEQ